MIYLVKAILSKKFVADEMLEVMTSIGQLAIKSESDTIRAQCRQVRL